MTWRDAAACADLHPAEADRLFFNDQPGNGQALAVLEAKRLCLTCPVRTDCLTEATNVEDWYRYGIWGGLTSNERAGRGPRRRARAS